MKTKMKLKRDTVLNVREEGILIEFLGFHLQGKSKNNLKSLLSYGQISVDNQTVYKHNLELKVGQKIVINWNVDRSVKAISGVKVVFEDEHLLVVDKSEGLLSVSTGGKKENTAYNKLKDYVKAKNPLAKIFIVHRLDKNTSGLMLFAKTPEVQQILQMDWKKYITSRKYAVLVEGKVEEKEGTIKTWLKENAAYVVYSSKVDNGGKLAITNYKVIKGTKKYSLVEASLETGRKNQIRVHMQDLKHPIVGDKKYGASGNPIKRLGLHARVLEFTHPITKEELKFATEVPGSFQRLVKLDNRKGKTVKKKGE